MNTSRSIAPAIPGTLPGGSTSCCQKVQPWPAQFPAISCGSLTPQFAIQSG